MNKKNRKKVSVLAILGVAIFIAFIIVAYAIAPRLGIISNFEREFPTGAVDSEVVYRIDSETILSSFNQSMDKIFMPVSSDSETNTQAPLDKIYSWTEDDFYKIANALHQFVWNESLENWKLYSAHYRKFQCQDNLHGFEAANFVFYRHDEKSYFVHTVWVNPFQQEVGAGLAIYDFTGKWKSIGLEQIEINNASDALEVAEINGGRESRLRSTNGCSIDILLAPYAFEYNSLIPPFSHRDWGWNVGYSDDNFEVIFEIVIDPFTGNYRILNVN